MTAKVDSEARLVRNVATARAKKIALQAQQTANLKLRDDLDFENKQLMRYLWLKALNSTGADSKVMWGLQKLSLTENLNMLS